MTKLKAMPKALYLLAALLLTGLLFVMPAMAQDTKEDEAGQEQTTDTPTPTPEQQPENPSEAALLFDSIELETLNTLNAMGVALVLPAPPDTNSTADYKVSIALGISVADALTAIINQNQEAFQKLAAQVHQYGETLGVEQAVLSKYKEIQDATASGEWKKLTSLIFGLKDDITGQLMREEMKEAAILSMSSGWVEGLYITAMSLEKNFKEDASDLLEDRSFAGSLKKHLDTLDAAWLEKPEVDALVKALPDIDAVINRPLDYKYTKEDAAKLVGILEPLRKVMLQ